MTFTTPMRRLAAGATTAVLTLGLLTPAALAAADELPVEDPTTMALDEAAAAPGAALPATSDAPADSASEQPGAEAPSPESPAVDPASLDDAVAETLAAPSDDSIAAQTASAAPAAGAASLLDSVTLAPGEIRTVTVAVADAQRYHFLILGEDVTGYLRTVGGQNYALGAFGGYSGNSILLTSHETGDVTLSLQNTGTTARAVPYAFAFERVGSPLTIFAGGLGSADLWIDAQLGRAGLTGQARMIDIAGTTTTLPMTPLAAGSTNYRATFGPLSAGRYLFEVSFEIDGITHQRIITAHAAEPETTPPYVEYTTEPAASNANGWFRRAVTASLAASDIGSGVWRLFVGLNATPAPVYSPRTNVVLATEGVHSLQYYAEDYQNNVSAPVTRTIRIDLTAPVVTLDGLEDDQRIEQDSDVVVDYDCSDALSGISECRGSSPSGERLDTSTPGVFTYSVVALDRAGNDTRIERSYTVYAPDTTAPELEIVAPATPASGWFTEPVTLQFRASDLGSGVAHIRWEYGTGSGVVIGSSEQSTGELSLTDTGVYTVQVWAEDSAGNRSEPQTSTVRIDVLAPRIELVSPEEPAGILPNGHYAQHERVVVDFACSDRGSGLDRCDATTPSGELLPTGTPGTHQLRIVATDIAGNRTERVLSYTVDAAASTPAASRDPRLAQTGAEFAIPGIVLVAVLLAAGAMLLTTRRLGGR
jgi:hypothetical protein